jgi:hypothetical protein
MLPSDVDGSIIVGMRIGPIFVPTMVLAFVDGVRLLKFRNCPSTMRLNDRLHASHCGAMA